MKMKSLINFEKRVVVTDKGKEWTYRVWGIPIFRYSLLEENDKIPDLDL